MSTVHAMLDKVTNCLDNIESKCLTGLILLDLTTAFDTVQHDILLGKLYHYDIREVVNQFFSYFSDRFQFVAINNNHYSSWRNIDMGVPQGSSLGPLLLLIYVNDLSNSVSCSPSLYADDTCLIITASCFIELEHRIKSEVDKVENWMIANKLFLNASKSHFIIINPPLDLNIICKTGVTKSTQSFKYLRVVIDNKLNFKKHIEKLELKVSRSVGILSKLKSYLPESAFFKLFYSLVHLHLSFGMPV